MAYIKADNEQEQVMFDYLEELRRDGDTNMFGAGPYLQGEFGIDRSEASRILGLWMKYHDVPERRLDGPGTLIVPKPGKMVTKYVRS